MPATLPIPATFQVQQEHSYAKSMVHPLTQTTDRYIVGDRFHDVPTTSGHKRETCKYHNMKYCPELLQYQSVTSEVINSRIKRVRLQSSSQQNPAHYFFYNRLMDYSHNMAIVSKQYRSIHAQLQKGETIVRDSLYRLVYACETCHIPGHSSSDCHVPMEC